MTETSRSQVTITLGRSGQVVKRAGAVLDSELSDRVPAVGSKRSVRDRLGSSVDAVQFDNKRLRGDNGRLNMKASNFMDDFHLSKDDLRFKIMKKTQTNGHQNTMDLRDMLTRRARLSNPKPVIPHEPRQGIQRGPDPETRDDRRRMVDPHPHRMPEPRTERKGMLNPRDPQVDRQRVGDDRCHMPEPRDDRDRDRDGQRMGEPQRAPKVNDMRQRAPEATNGKYTSMRTSEAMEFSRNSYSHSPWTLEHIRRKSPVLHNSRRLSPPPPLPPPQPPRRTIIREYDDHPRPVAYPTREIGEISRPMPTPPFLTKPSLTAGPTKSIGPLVPSLPPGGNLQRSQYPVEEHLTVESFLRSLGLEKYVISFKVEEVDMAALSQMGDHDLKELGIPMGPRKKILLALAARTRRQAR